MAAEPDAYSTVLEVVLKPSQAVSSEELMMGSSVALS